MSERRPRRRQPNGRAGVNAALRGADPERLITEAAFAALRALVEEAWPVVVPAEPSQPNWHIDTICEHLEALARGEFWSLLINVPPRHAADVGGELLGGALHARQPGDAPARG